MKKLIPVFTLVLMIMVLPAVFVVAEEAPLTLLQEPENTGQKSSGQQIPQMSPSGQMGQGVGEQMVLYDIYGVVPTKAPVPFVYIGIGVALLLLLAALIYWFYKRRGRKTITPDIPPWERALIELQDARALLGQNKGLLYMDRASQILRRYLEERFAVQSTRQTTREFLVSLKNSKDSEINSYKMELQHCLEQADMAKFAHKEQDEKNLIVMEQAVSTFVQATSPSEKRLEDEK